MVKQNTDTPSPIPGLEVVGRGIHIRPRQPYELKNVLFERRDQRLIHSRETGQRYAIPTGYEVNDSPPMPANQSLNQTMIEESWERFDKRFSLDASVAAGNGLFTVDVSTSQSQQVSSQTACYYAVRSSFIPLWTVYLINTAGIISTSRSPPLSVTATDAPTSASSSATAPTSSSGPGWGARPRWYSR